MSPVHISVASNKAAFSTNPASCRNTLLMLSGIPTGAHPVLQLCPFSYPYRCARSVGSTLQGSLGKRITFIYHVPQCRFARPTRSTFAVGLLFFFFLTRKPARETPVICLRLQPLDPGCPTCHRRAAQSIELLANPHQPAPQVLLLPGCHSCPRHVVVPRRKALCTILPRNVTFLWTHFHIL